MIDKQQRKISTAESIQVERLRREYIGTDWLGELPRQVSYYCVDLLAKQHRKALIKEQYGIPCAHDMLPKLEAREVIEKAEIDPYWWLDRDLADEYPHLRIQNPDVVINTRGRPRNHGAFGEETPVATQQPWSTQESRQKQLGRSLDSHPMSSSVRRRLSQWEHGESLQQLDTADAAPSSTPATASQRRRGRPPGSKNKPKPTVPAKRARDQGSGHGRAIRRTVNGLRKVIDEEEEDDDYSDESE
ncbi:hypothetical protein F4677DRAFT_439492 [Hypoxylon crocopeplum]|nr:hypothetical protein F4677DRAFT_439492 [Hypoxylon crocopeplum]